MNNSIEKKTSSDVIERGQYIMAFGLLAMLVIVTNIPVLVIFFFAVFAYAVLKMFSAAGRSETREIFEFYLTANEILRDDDRRWFGFEIQEAIFRGETIVNRMDGAPPLVHFALGALYDKLGDAKSAAQHLARTAAESGGEERAFLNPSPELRAYARVLRKIEREPGDAPLTSSAVRALERSRRIRGASLLERSTAEAARLAAVSDAQEHHILAADNGSDEAGRAAEKSNVRTFVPETRAADADVEKRPRKTAAKSKEDQYQDRKPITEVLRDIYDSNAR